MNQVIFSVIVTAYNQPQEIKRAVESVLNQTLKCFELIVVDDCSTDETPKVLADFAAENSCMKVIRLEYNSSSHTARCVGVEAASGKYCIFLDGDDYLNTDALEKLYNQIILKNPDFDICEYSYICQPTKEIINPIEWTNDKPRIEYYLQPKYIVNVWNKLYKTELLKKAFSNMKKEYIRCGDDTYESICISYFAKKVITTDIIVLNYVLGEGVSLRKNNFESNQRHCQSLQTCLNCLKNFFDNNPYEKKELLLKTIETNFFNWILSVMKNNTELEDISSSLILLPKYFPIELIKPHFAKLYSGKLRIKKLKCLIKRCLKC